MWYFQIINICTSIIFPQDSFLKVKIDLEFTKLRRDIRRHYDTSVIGNKF